MSTQANVEVVDLDNGIIAERWHRAVGVDGVVIVVEHADDAQRREVARRGVAASGWAASTESQAAP